MVTFKLARLEDLEDRSVRPFPVKDILLVLLVVAIMVIAVVAALRTAPPRAAERQHCSHIDYLAGRCDHE